MISRFGSLLAGAALLFAPASQAASSYSVASPVLGYVFDSDAGSIYRVGGIPGAASLGDALDLGVRLTHAVFAPNQRFAIARDIEGRALFVDLSATPSRVTVLEGALDGAAGMMISPMARHAALYSAETGRIQLLKGVPEAPSVGETLRLDRGVGDWTSFAISDQGVVLAATARPGSGGSLYALRLGRAPVRVGGVQRAADLAFFAGNNDAVVADGAASEVILYRDVVALRQSRVLASERDSVRSPLQVNPTADGGYVAVAVPGGIVSVPVMGGMPAFTACACAPTVLEPLAGGNVFRLTDDVREPLQIAEVSMESRMLFVPALPGDDDSQK